MLEHLWLPCMVTVAAIALSAILFKEFLKKRAGQTTVVGSADNASATENGTVESDACTSTSPQVNETAPSSGYDYEVFLSFRGSDTRSGFTDFLYTSLTNAGIRTFKDDEDLRKGEEFAPELLQAIKQSKISIPIFSKNYASSAWCLKELVQMVECQKTKEQKIMPIFYDVAPLEVRRQTEGYGKAFRSHENKKRYGEKTIREWNAALKKVSFLKGWELHNMLNRREGEFARELTEMIFTVLKKAHPVVSDYLVNVDNQVDEIMKMIGAQSRGTRIIGMHGMGGIGKTTIAKLIYNRLSHDFMNCCFLPDIRETSKVKGIPYLQNQLISALKMTSINIKHIDEGTQTIKDKLSNKRVLLLLDDMHKKREMDALVGERNWFGKGSKIIITTRNKEILDVFKVDDRYELTGMDCNQSLQLFSKHAFRRNSPLDGYIDKSNRAIRIAGGLPLALEVMGSLLSRTEKKDWDLTLEQLENVPLTEVQSKLEISYNALTFRQKHIFLDIACLFIGYDKDILVHFWDAKLFPKGVLQVLENLSLIKIKEHNLVWMHDQLRDLGREIVRRESNMKIEKQSRVWNPKEALDLLRRHEGKTKVEALRLEFDHKEEYCFTWKDFKRISNLRFLEVDGLGGNFGVEKRLLWRKPPSNDHSTNYFQENSNLLPQLRWLSWRKIPPTLNITNFSMKDVVILNLSVSAIRHDWKGWSYIEVMNNLKVLDLSDSYSLKRTPNFSTHSNLERLTLKECLSLIEIDESICQLKHLVSLDVFHCVCLRRLPDKFGEGLDLAKLEYLSLNDCKSLEMLPESIGDLKSLIELDISNTLIKELPNSIGNLEKLKVLKMQGSSLSKIPDVLWSITSLETIEASNRSSKMDFHVRIGDGISGSQSLRILKLKAEIDALPRLPESLITLVLDRVDMNTFPDLSNLTNLKELDLRFGPEETFDGLVGVSMPPWIGNLSSLESLNLHFPCETASPADFTLPPRLNSLHFHCPNLPSLPSLPSSLSSLILNYCKSLCSMEDLSNLKKLSTLYISFATIPEIPGLVCLENLRDLYLQSLKQVKILPDLSNLNKLRYLVVGSCEKLVEIQGQLPQSLEKLRIYRCGSLRKLPSLSRSMGLRKVVIRTCDRLAQIQGELPESLEKLVIDSCQSLQELPARSSSKGLREVKITRCRKLNSEEDSEPEYNSEEDE